MRSSTTRKKVEGSLVMANSCKILEKPCEQMIFQVYRLRGLSLLGITSANHRVKFLRDWTGLLPIQPGESCSLIMVPQTWIILIRITGLSSSTLIRAIPRPGGPSLGNSVSIMSGYWRRTIRISSLMVGKTPKGSQTSTKPWATSLPT